MVNPTPLRQRQTGFRLPLGEWFNDIIDRVNGLVAGTLTGSWAGTFNGALIGTGATVTTSQPLLNLTQTWLNAGVTFTGLKFNATDTASAAGSLLLDLQVGGVSKLTVSKGGEISTSSSITTTGGNILLNNNYARLFFGSDVILNRDAANTLALRNGTAAQKFSAYNTYTDASNYERGVFDWAGTANTLRIGTEAAGTGTVRNIQLVAGSNSVTMTPGASNLLTLNGGLKTTGATFALQTATTLTDNAAAQVATMTNGPAAGNPTKWIAINDNGVTRYIPAW